jgi:hypothetical protein
MHDPDRRQFAVATFTNVFDTTPCRDVLSLRQIVTGLTRFELKPKYPAKLRSAEERADRALATWRRGIAGEATRRIEAALTEGRSADDAVAAWRSELVTEVMDEAKRGLRLWSPVWYADGSRRTSDGVVHHSALVLDLDQAPDVDAVLDAFSPWFAIAHSTWSYRPDRPKMRIILPLAAPVPTRSWRGLWAWAARRCPSPVDPAGQSESATFALPATMIATTPRLTRVRPGPLLDPLATGAVPHAAEPPSAAHPAPTGTPFRGGDGTHTWIGDPPTEAQLSTSGWRPDDDAFDLFG